MSGKHNSDKHSNHVDIDERVDCDTFQIGPGGVFIDGRCVNGPNTGQED